MNEKYLKLTIEIIFLIAIITVFITSAFIGRHYNADISSMYGNTARELSHGWEYQANHVTRELGGLPETIELSVPTDSIMLYYTLPEELPRNSCLEFISRQTSVEVFLDGTKIYAYGIDDNRLLNRLLGTPRNEILLPIDAGGGEISIRLISPDAKENYHISAITLGSRAELLHRFINSNMGLIIFSAFSVFFCVLLLFVLVFFKIKKVPINASAFISFLVFVMLSVTWIITDSNILQLLVYDFSRVYFISHMAFMLLPVPFILFMLQTTSHRSGWYGGLCFIYLFGFFLRTGLFFAGIASLEESLYITHIIMGISVVAGCVLLVREWRMNRDRTVLMALAGFASLAICLLISLVLFFMYPERRYSALFCLVLFMMMIAMLCRFFWQIQSMAKESINAKLYYKMAYIDVMTNLANRMAFENDMHSIQENPDCYTLTIAVFDLNRLKHVNDTYGHNAGDGLIKCAADCILDKFGSVGKCYRIGGDEFVVILKDFSEQSLERIVERFRISVAETSLRNSEELSISVGYASGPAQGERFAYRLFAEADKQMYARKEEWASLSEER